MITLNTGDAIRALASVTNVVTYNVSGYKGINVINSDGLVTGSEADIYLTDAINTVITEVVFRNTDSTARTITLYRKIASGTSGALFSISLGIGYTAVLNSRGLFVYDTNGLLQTLGAGGAGDVVGPASATGDNIAVFNSTTGKLIKDGGREISDLATSGHNHSGVYAPAASGVTGGDSHDHNGGDGAQIDHGGLGGLGDDDHTQYQLESLDYSLADGKNFVINSTLGTDHTCSGLCTTKTAGENLVFGDICYLKSDGKIWKTDADAIATMPALYMAVATINADAAGRVLRVGEAVDASWNWTVGGLLYVSGTAGALTQTAPSGTNKVVQIVGKALAATIITFLPDQGFLELA